MKNITLFKPIILRSSLDDMTLSQKEIALDLLANRKLLVPGSDGLRFIPLSRKQRPKEKLPKFYLYGSEAVCYYRQSLGLPDVSITDIEIDDIVAATEDFDTLYDLLFLLNRVRMRNDRNRKLHEYGAPGIILWNEYRTLQEYVESLQDNNWCGHPMINRYNISDSDEEPEWEEEIRKSLADIGYELAGSKNTAEPVIKAQ